MSKQKVSTDDKAKLALRAKEAQETLRKSNIGQNENISIMDSDEESKNNFLPSQKSKQLKKNIKSQNKQLAQFDEDGQPVNLEIYYLLKLQQNLIYNAASLHERLMKLIESSYDYSKLLQ